MTRYIDTDTAKVVLKQLLYETAMNNLDCSDVYVDIAENRLPYYINAIPTADVVERKKGRWNTDKESPEYATCSVCGHCDWDCTESEYFKYCPNCGAQMGSE